MSWSIILKFMLLIICFVCVVAVIFVSCKYYKVLTRQKEYIIMLINEKSFVAEKYVRQKNNNLDSLPHNVLCLGNSITLHTPLDEVNWYSSHGMAASKPDSDYCHRLEHMLKKYNSMSTVTPVNIASWERDFSINLDSLLKEHCENKDIIVIRIGENVTENVNDFSEALSKLILYCKQYTDKIILTGQYWESSIKELAIINNANRYNLTYVPLSWIWSLYRTECSPREGDILYDTKGEPYSVKGDFINTHPNDKGMELIAVAIFNSL